MWAETIQLAQPLHDPLGRSRPSGRNLSNHMSNANVLLGVDIGGTKVAAGIVSQDADPTI